MLKRGEHIQVLIRRRHSDGKVELGHQRGSGVLRGSMHVGKFIREELDHPDDLADWLEDLAAEVRSSRRRKAG